MTALSALLLLFLTFAFLFLFAHLGGVHQLMDDLMSLHFVIYQESLPFEFQLTSGSFLGDFFHMVLFILSILLHVEFSQVHIFTTHKLTLSPLLNALFVVFGLVASQLDLDFSGVFEAKLVQGIVEIDQSKIRIKDFVHKLTTTFFHLVVSKVQ